MNLLSKEEIKNILKKKGASKKLGQNFLIKESIINEMIEETNISSKDTILEIGPGLGALTQKLLQTKAKRIIAVEKDKRMINFLKDNFQKTSLQIIEEDFLKLNLDKFPSNLKVVSNLPFYAATPIIRKLANCNKVELMILIIQKEVAERIQAKNKNSFLSVILGLKTTSKVIKKVPRSSFWPKPKVDGAIIKITPHNKYPKGKGFYDNFFKIVETGFKHPRKQIKNNLNYLENFSKEEIIKFLNNSEIDPRSRPEKIEVSSWVRLAKEFDFNKKRK